MLVMISHGFGMDVSSLSFFFHLPIVVSLCVCVFNMCMLDILGTICYSYNSF